MVTREPMGAGVLAGVMAQVMAAAALVTGCAVDSGALDGDGAATEETSAETETGESSSSDTSGTTETSGDETTEDTTTEGETEGETTEGETGPQRPMLGEDWAWILPIDLGLRDDGGGGGHFSAPRLNNPGGHSGIDVLAPIGTELYAVCDGPVLAGFDGGYGNWVQLACPIPEVLAADLGTELWASVLYAHLDTTAVLDGQDVRRGQTLGTVGKSGNAGAAVINPHVHFEIAIQDSLAAAQAETHASANHDPNAAGDVFAAAFADRCLDVLGFESTTGPTMKGRRPDPFMLLTCLSGDKPALAVPDPGLQSDPTPWSEHYAADGFDVDVGLQ